MAAADQGPGSPRVFSDFTCWLHGQPGSSAAEEVTDMRTAACMCTRRAFNPLLSISIALSVVGCGRAAAPWQDNCPNGDWKV